jgi:hypothetical protein
MDGWETFSVELRGGLITNLSPLQQGVNRPGSARRLINFEPSIEGGYKKVKGYVKYDDTMIPPYGSVLVHGGSQTGTSLLVDGVYTEPEAGDTFTIAGVAGTYTVVSSTIDAAYRYTLVITPTLDSSPANAAALTFVTTTSKHLARGIFAWDNSNVFVAKNTAVYKTVGSGMTLVSKPAYGTTLVDGGSQTGTTLVADGFDYFPQAGDIFTISGVDLTYSVVSSVAAYSDPATKEVNVTISPALDSSPADDAAITFYSSKFSAFTKMRFDRFNYDGTERIVMVNGIDYPSFYDGTSFIPFASATSDVQGASHVCNHKNALFFAKDDMLSFTAPYAYDTLETATGAGLIRVGDPITGLISFRDELFIFTEESIYRLSGSSLDTFDMQPVTREIGCIHTDTIQEVGTDVLFLAQDGLRQLSATDRVGDFNFANVSKSVQSEFSTFRTLSTSYASIIIRGKSQYRIFGWSSSTANNSALGFVTTMLAKEAQDDDNFAFAQLQGFNAYVGHSHFFEGVETSVFANDDGYVYEMDTGNTMDGSGLFASFATPHWPINNPRLRKTVYKAHIYSNPEGGFTFTLALKLDFDGKDVVQPQATEVTNTGTGGSFYGSSRYGTGIYGDLLVKVFTVPMVGAGFTTSLEFATTGTGAPFALDAVILEYREDDRR